MARIPSQKPMVMTKLERRIHNEKVLLAARWRSAMSVSFMVSAALAVAVGLLPLEVKSSLNWWIAMFLGIGCSAVGYYAKCRAISDLDQLMDEQRSAAAPFASPLTPCPGRCHVLALGALEATAGSLADM